MGNDLLTDDAVALRVARQIAGLGLRDVDVQESSESGFALLDILVGYQRVVIVDAIVTGRVEPGTILELQLGELRPVAAPSPHYAGLPEIFELAARLELPVPSQVRIVAMEAADITSLGCGLTPAVAAALPGLVARVWTALTE